MGTLEMADSVELPASVAEPSDFRAVLWSDSDAEPEFASEMEIIVQADDVRNVVLLVDGDNIVEDVLVEILGNDRAGRAPEPRLFFKDTELQKQKTLADCGIELGSVLHLKCTPRVLALAHEPRFKDLTEGWNYILVNCTASIVFDFEKNSKLSLADYGIQDGSILHLECTNYVYESANEIERPNVISKRKKIILIDQPLAIWKKEHDKVLLGLLVEQIRKGGREILNFETDSWCDIVAKFNEATGLKYDYKHLNERFSFYTREYHIVNRIRHHPKFSWDHQRQVVIATDANWNEYIKGDPDARPYRRRAVPYIDLLEIMFADKEES